MTKAKAFVWSIAAHLVSTQHVIQNQNHSWVSEDHLNLALSQHNISLVRYLIENYNSKTMALPGGPRISSR